MAEMTGIGGIFFRSKDPAALQAWYTKNLRLPVDEEGYVVIRWGGEVQGSTVWAPFPEDTEYFGARERTFMINYRVDNLEQMLEQLRQGGARIDSARHEDVNGRFGWAWDPEGNRIELWQPAEGM